MNGELYHADVARVWTQLFAAGDLIETLLKFLHHFEVAFPIKGTAKSVVPSLFSSSRTADYIKERKKRFEENADRNLKLQRTYKFKFLPLGFFPRLAVRALHIPNTQLIASWRLGFILRHSSAYGLLEYDPKEYLLVVTVVAPTNRNLLFPHLLQQTDSLIKTSYSNVKVEVRPFPLPFAAFWFLICCFAFILAPRGLSPSVGSSTPSVSVRGSVGGFPGWRAKLLLRNDGRANGRYCSRRLPQLHP